jgi:hypothetical protein
MALTITVPLNNGDGSIASFELTLPVGAPAGKYAWSSSQTATGTVTARNDGRSALFTPVAHNSGTATVITATVKNALGVTAGWQPGKLYFLGDTILDSNGHAQQVSAATKFVPTRYTPNAGYIPGSVSLVLTGGSAASSNDPKTGNPYLVAITGISASVPSSFAAGQLVTIAGMTGSVASLNGTWTLLAVGANSISISYNGAAVSASVTAASTAYVPGDALIASLAQGDQGLYNGNYQYGVVLNQGQGTNGDWPAGAIAANSGNLTKPYPTSAASVSFTACGYSSGGSIGRLAHPFLPSSDTGTAGISTPVPAVAWQPVTNYALGFQIIDENGNIQQVFKAGTSGTQYPAFSGSSTTVDNTVTWKYISAATLGYSNVSVVEIAKYSEVGSGALGSFALTAALNATAAGITRYAGSFGTAANSNGFAGYVFTVAGDSVNAGNNGVFICTASTSAYLYLANTGGVTHSFTGTAVNSGLRAYVDGAGNVHVGWVTQVGEVQFAEPVATTPAFSTGGGRIRYRSILRQPVCFLCRRSYPLPYSFPC